MAELVLPVDSINLGSQSPHLQVIPPISSWMYVVQAKKSLKKYDYLFRNRMGVSSVMVSD